MHTFPCAEGEIHSPAARYDKQGIGGLSEAYADGEIHSLTLGMTYSG